MKYSQLANTLSPVPPRTAYDSFADHCADRKSDNGKHDRRNQTCQSLRPGVIMIFVEVITAHYPLPLLCRSREKDLTFTLEDNSSQTSKSARVKWGRDGVLCSLLSPCHNLGVVIIVWKRFKQYHNYRGANPPVSGGVFFSFTSPPTTFPFSISLKLPIFADKWQLRKRYAKNGSEFDILLLCGRYATYSRTLVVTCESLRGGWLKSKYHCEETESSRWASDVIVLRVCVCKYFDRVWCLLPTNNLTLVSPSVGQENMLTSKICSGRAFSWTIDAMPRSLLLSWKLKIWKPFIPFPYFRPCLWIEIMRKLKKLLWVHPFYFSNDSVTVTPEYAPMWAFTFPRTFCKFIRNFKHYNVCINTETASNPPHKAIDWGCMISSPRNIIDNYVVRTSRYEQRSKTVFIKFQASRCQRQLWDRYIRYTERWMRSVNRIKQSFFCLYNCV